MQREAASRRGDVIRSGPHLYEIEIDGGQQREQRLPPSQINVSMLTFIATYEFCRQDLHSVKMNPFLISRDRMKGDVIPIMTPKT